MSGYFEPPLIETLSQIASLVEAKEALEEEVTRRADNVTRSLFDLKNNNGRQEAFKALNEQGFHDGDTESWASSVEIESHKGQQCVRITSTAYACQNHWEGHLYVPVEVFDAGPAAFDAWLGEIVAAHEEEKARVEAARQEAAAKAERETFERLKAKFSPEEVEDGNG